MKDTRSVRDLWSVGPSTEQDLHDLGITRVDQLRGKDAAKLYAKLCRLAGRQLDPCVQDVFSAAIAQAENPNLPEPRKRWYYWSRIRKGEEGK